MLARVAVALLCWCLATACATAPQPAASSDSQPAASRDIQPAASRDSESVATAALLRDALDSEALYTLVADVKPVSCGFWSAWIDTSAPDLAAMQAVRARLRCLHDEVCWADVAAFHQEHNGRRAVQAYVVHKPALRRLLAEHASFFAPLGLLPDTHPAEVFAVVERLPMLQRHRGMGLLFGYPLPAIEFFVSAAAAREPGDAPVPRRFVQIPTFGAAEGRFVYAMPADSVDGEADLALRARAAPVLQRYREARATVVAEDPASWLRLLRELRAALQAVPDR